ncbi:MAG TPA: MBL fold metallo-hydrolase [Syntrophales bacterium]|nr:MBL fold metallo-hydrolase [Syntrophobacterales bacterium]HQL89761.1 MBL fold metallo-hydrolase [Syntrophales bacterium]
MGKPERIVEGVWLVGGPNISLSEDATVFVIDFSGELVMIDAGAGRSARTLVRNIEAAGLDPAKISTLILTHCHIDHIGAAPYFREAFGCRLAAHELDTRAIEEGDPVMTAANWYETEFPPTPIDIRIRGDHEILNCGGEELHVLHTPGHTPGSLCLYLDREGKRVLFGQDIHGPFLPGFGSDVSRWRKSMEKLLALDADILCEGHFGIFRTKEQVSKYIRNYLRQYA